MPPNSSRQLIYVTFDTPLGPVGITASANGLLAITLPSQPVQKAQRQPPHQFTGLIERLQAYFNGRKVAFPDKLDLSAATPFQAKVWEITRLIPYGETRSYRWVADQMGKPGAVRAVGQALARNPLPVIIPCHRVIGSNGTLGGFSGGLEMKQKLLRLEHATIPAKRVRKQPVPSSPFCKGRARGI